MRFWRRMHTLPKVCIRCSETAPENGVGLLFQFYRVFFNKNECVHTLLFRRRYVSQPGATYARRGSNVCTALDVRFQRRTGPRPRPMHGAECTRCSKGATYAWGRMHTLLQGSNLCVGLHAYVAPWGQPMHGAARIRRSKGATYAWGRMHTLLPGSNLCMGLHAYVALREQPMHGPARIRCPPGSTYASGAFYKISL